MVLNTRIDESGFAHPGYMRENTSIETAYALVTEKPIVMICEPFFTHRVPQQIQRLISEHLYQIPIVDVDSLSDEDLYAYLLGLSESKLNYGICAEDASMVMKEVVKLARTYRHAWQRYCSDKSC